MTPLLPTLGRVGSPDDTATVYVDVSLDHLGVDGSVSTEFAGRSGRLTLVPGVTHTQDVSVIRGPLANFFVTAVSITSAPDTPIEGSIEALSAEATTTAVDEPTIFWTSGDTSVLTVSNDTAAAVRSGVVELIASSGAFADTTSVVVIIPPVDSVLVSPDSTDVIEGTSASYSVELFDSGGAILIGRSVRWTTEDSAVATVDSLSGEVTGVAPGVTDVTATSEGISDNAVVLVLPLPPPGKLNRWIAGDGDWNVGSNWSKGTVPSPSDSAVVDGPGSFTVSVTSDHSVGSLTISALDAVLRIDAGTGARTFTVSENLTNEGRITLRDTSSDTQVARLIVTGGVLRNESTGRIDTEGTGSNPREIVGEIVNEGIVETTTAPMLFSATDADHTGSGLWYASVGEISVSGNLTSTWTLAFNLGGTSAGRSYFRLLVSGTVTLDGTLSATLTGDFDPVVPNAFTLITGSSVSGSFTTTNLPAIADAWDIDLTSGTSLVLRVQ